MAMTILNNSSTAMSLGELNKNISKLGEALAKISTGMRIVGASSDSASFAISEIMREQIRSLEQDIQNVQNGVSMFKTAHGGIENIVDELRSLKELAINAANDSNTDDDRAIIQKEFDKRRETIDDIATWTTYNTKPLLDGGYVRSSGADRGTSDVFMNNVTDLFNLPRTIMRGKSAETVKWVNGLEAYGRIPVYEESTSTTDDTEEEGNEKWTTLDFSNAKTLVGSKASVSDMDKQGFSILCSDYLWCPSFHGFVFDSSMSVGTAKKSLITSGPVYFIGIGGAESTDDLAGAIYSGLSNLITKHTQDDNDKSAKARKEREDWPESIDEDGTIYLAGYGEANGKTLDEASVLTQHDANVAVRIVEGAIDYALNEATYVGAYLQRLDYTESNVTTQDTSVQNAESTIRDADMAKEMTEYTKANVLTQAAQSMLAQANQNLAGVLTLLQ